MVGSLREWEGQFKEECHGALGCRKRVHWKKHTVWWKSFTNVMVGIAELCYEFPRNPFNVHSSGDQTKWLVHFRSSSFSRPVVSDSLRPHELQHARPPCPPPTPRVHPNSCALSRWCHPAILSSVIPFFSCPQSLPASESFPMSQLLIRL